VSDSEIRRVPGWLVLLVVVALVGVVGLLIVSGTRR
jgi:hypothetical protein